MILARTIKGKGVSFVEGKDGWHGKAFKKGEELDRALAELEAQFVPVPTGAVEPGGRRFRSRPSGRSAVGRAKPVAPPAYKLGDQVATREAYGTALAKLGEADRARRRARRRREELDLQRPVREGVPGALLPELHRRAGDGRRGDGAGRARRDSVSLDVRLLPDARRRLHPHGGDQQRRTSSWPARTPACRLARTARRRWRSRIWRCIARRAEHHRAVSRATRSARSGCVALDGLSSRARVHPHEPAEDAGDLRATTRRSRSAG